MENINSSELALVLNAEHIGKNRLINSIISYSVKNTNNNTITWLSEKKNNLFDPAIEGTIIVSNSANIPPGINYTLLLVNNPRRAFQRILQLFYSESNIKKIESSAIIYSTAIIGDDCYIGYNVVIEDNVKIGNNTVIMHNSVILKDTIIGNNCIIGSNCTIGGLGFGYEKNDDGEFEFIYHIGNVLIEDNVEIGNNTCIDRAVLGNTHIEKNVKIDNLVHIAHGCQIGHNSLIIANAMVAGSVVVGENTWVAPSSSILNNMVIGNNVTIGLGAVVIKDVDSHDVVVGNPSKSIKKTN